MSTLVTNIGELVTNDPAVDDGPLGVIADAALVVEHGHVAWAGPAAGAPDADTRVDLGGRAVLPGFVDSHAHLVFAGDRAAEFAARMAGEPYTGGGIRDDAEWTVVTGRVVGDELADAGHQRAHASSQSGSIAAARSRPTSPSTCCPSETTTRPSTTTVCTSAAPAVMTN